MLMNKCGGLQQSGRRNSKSTQVASVGCRRARGAEKPEKFELCRNRRTPSRRLEGELFSVLWLAHVLELLEGEHPRRALFSSHTARTAELRIEAV